MNVSIQIVITDPETECEPETSHAASAMIQPPITPDQKTVAAGFAIASPPSCASSATKCGFNAGVHEASTAKANAPSTFAGKTTAHKRIVFQNSRFSASTSATGYSVFSVNSCARPTITTMNPSG